MYHHRPSNLAIKLTRPGEFGWGGNIQTYLRRLAWTNILFDDDVAVAGLTQLPGESLPRLVTTQPWYDAQEASPHPNAAEIQTYMRAKGFLKVADEGYVHEHLDIYASDAKPDNFIRTISGMIRPIDLILGQTDEQEYRRLRDLAEDLPQMPGPDRRSEETGLGDRLQFSQTELETQHTSDGSRAPKSARRASSSQQTTPPQPSLNETLGAPGTPLRSLLDKLGVRDLDTHVFTEVQAQQLVTLLKQDTPPKLDTLVRGITGDNTHSSEQIRTIVEEFASFMPPALARQLAKHPVAIAFDQKLAKKVAVYRPEDNSIAVNPKITDLSKLRRTLFHELVHWAHLKGPSSFRERVTALASRRTSGFTEPQLILYKAPGLLYDLEVRGMRDDWADINGDEYAGRVYRRAAASLAVEVPTVHLEKLTYHSSELADYLNHRSNRTGHRSWREAFLTCLDPFLPSNPQP